jgi:hypothetical protein
MSLNTAGIYYSNKYPNGVGTTLNVAKQMGNSFTPGVTDSEIEHSGTLVAVEVSYQFDMPNKLVGAVGFDMTSGDDPTTPDQEGFDDLYLTGHKFHGAMDFFTGSSNNMSAGVKDMYVKGWLLAKEDLWFGAAAHVLGSSEKFISAEDPTKEADSYGNEVDIFIKYEMKPETSMTCGLGYFMPSEDWLTSSADSGLWGYVQIVSKFDVDF